jgi:hypothetical protein
VQERAGITSDPDPFERFYREHVEAVQRFVARRMDDPYLAADLTAGASAFTVLPPLTNRCGGTGGGTPRTSATSATHLSRLTVRFPHSCENRYGP